MQYSYFVDITSWFFIAFLAGSALEMLFSNFLDWLNAEKTDIKRKTKALYGLGELARKLFPTRKINKAMDYKRISDGFSDMVSSAHSTIMTLVLMFGVLPWLLHAVMSAFPGLSVVWCWIITTGIGTIVGTVAGIPADLYRTFSIEGRFGFNTTTKRTFFSDMVKGLLVGMVISVVIQLTINYALELFFGFETMSVLGILVFVASLMLLGKAMEWVYMNLVMPMFNKFEPLRNKRLAAKLRKLCESCDFPLKEVEVMDASRRSNHSNAFICGSFGKKRIILFDTMLKNMTDDEILAVVAHEIGHGKLHHLLYGSIEGVAASALAMTATFVLMKMPEFYHAFGYSWITPENINEHLLVGFSLATTFIGAFTWVLEPFGSWLSRKMEYAADRFSVERRGVKRESLVSALMKLSAENLSDLFPHPAYEFANYSHPSILNRVAAIRKNATRKRTGKGGKKTKEV